ncbi:MAG: aminotransferase class I/II-fold pyridoxal phosphate-dependent enzyme, partial [Pirellulales bacterium]|nr:aminotransferase class I/II-fold pyridoxal phosphate-dependent enzyme [Pirellulales bacterium]
MPPTLSRLVEALEPSATMAMAAKARELKAAGTTIYDLTLGEPDFGTPEHICQAATRAMREGKTRYTPATGVPELKKAIVDQYCQRHGLDYDPSQVAVSNGAKHALHNVFTVLLNPGDEAIIPAPYWVSYGALVELCGAKPVIVQTEQANNFKLTP